ncbi:hypothetical protein [Ruegeria arenilitoris]|uniref:hypothetical protein n=1 Tax=Ruegeria arenilitoris TaxID=1173585 RepID=UPI0014798D5B|nr:hypothetical protein [Ruegeria arenilitoris]
MRVVVSLSVAVLLVHYWEIDVSELSVLGIRLRIEQTQGVITTVLLISLVSHFVQWSGDFLSLRNWNVALKSTEVPILFGGKSKLVSKLELYLKDIEKFRESIEGTEFKGADEQIASLANETRQLKRFVCGDSAFAWFYVVGWCLVLPLTICFWAWAVI